MQQTLLQRSNRLRRLFVTGTDTGVGKTLVGSALAAAWRRDGRRVAVMKPVETGCEPGPDGVLVAADAARLAAAAGGDADPALVCPNRYALPAAPLVAAELAGCPVDLDAVARAAETLAAAADVLLVEGAGGLLVPLRRDLSMADLAAGFGAPLLVVARASLGTINHTLLTLEAARRRGLAVAGVVLNRVVAAEGADERATPQLLADLGAPILGTLPHLPRDATDDTLAAAAREHLDLDHLWRAIDPDYFPRQNRANT